MTDDDPLQGNKTFSGVSLSTRSLFLSLLLHTCSQSLPHLNFIFAQMVQKHKLNKDLYLFTQEPVLAKVENPVTCLGKDILIRTIIIINYNLLLLRLIIVKLYKNHLASSQQCFQTISRLKQNL